MTSNKVTVSQVSDVTTVKVTTAGPQGPAFADGDIGDIVISGGGTVATIDNEAVNNAKIASDAAIALSKLATGALPTDITVTSANISDLSIVDADINASAAIALSKLATGALPTAITVTSANISDLSILNADVNANASIQLSKLEVIASNKIVGNDSGNAVPKELTPAEVRTIINVEDGATADQTAAEILTAIKTVHGATSGLDADLLDGRDTSSSGAANTIALRDASGDLFATNFSGSGASLTSLNASNISSGTIAAARVPTLNQDTTGTATKVVVGLGSEDQSYYLAFTDNNGTSQALNVDGSLNYNPSTNTLVAGTFSGSGASLTANTIPYASLVNIAANRVLGRSNAGAVEATQVHTDMIANSAINADKLATSAVTFAKMQDVAQYVLLGRTSSGDGPVQTLTAIPDGVTGTTQSASDNSTKIATTAYTDTAIANLVDSSPGTLNTLNELAAALGDDASFSTTVTNSIATKLPLAGGTLTGSLGIGTSPLRQLHIHEPTVGTCALMLTNSTTGVANDGKGFQFKIGSDGTANIDQREDKGLDIIMNGNTALGFDTSRNATFSGNVALNGATTGVPLHVYGSSDTAPIIAFTRNTTHGDWQGAGLGMVDEGGSYKGALTFYTHDSNGTKNASVTEKLRIASNGDATFTDHINVKGGGTANKFSTTSDGAEITGTGLITSTVNTALNLNKASGQVNLAFQVNGSTKWNIGTDELGGGTDDFFIYHASTGQSPLKFSATDDATFAGDITVSNTAPSISLVDTNNNSDYKIKNVDGALAIQDTSNSDANRLIVQADGSININGATTFAGNVSLPDDKKLQFGDATTPDLKIYHVGSANDSYIDDQGSGQLRLCSSEIAGLNAAHDAYIFRAKSDAGVELYYAGDSTAKLETTSDGVLVSGTANEQRFTDTTVYSATTGARRGIYVFNEGHTDGGYASIELAAEDAQGYFGSTILSSIATGTDYANDFVIQTRHAANYKESLRISSEGHATFAENVTLGGSLYVPDGEIVGCGDPSSPDLRMYHVAGGDSFIKNTTGNFQITCDEFRLKTVTNSETIIQASQQGEVQLYFDNERKFQTTEAGAVSIGSLGISTQITGNPVEDATPTLAFFGAADDTTTSARILAKFVGTQSGTANATELQFHTKPASLGPGSHPLLALTLDKDQNAEFAGHINLPDYKRIYFGSAETPDFSIYHHAGGSTYLETTNTTGNLIIDNSVGNDLYVNSGNDIHLRPQGTEKGIEVIGNGGVKLYYDASENSTARLSTTATGVTITSPSHDGGLSVLAGGNNQETRINLQGKAADGTAHDWVIGASRSADKFYISNTSSTLFSILDGGDATFAGKLIVDGASAYDAFSSSSMYVDGYVCMGKTDTSIAGDEQIGGLRFYSNDTNINSGNFLQVGGLDLEADGDFLADDAPTRMVFKTMKDGTTTLTEALKLDSSQNATFAGSVYVSSDSNKIYAGAENEMQVFHDGTQSIIKDTRNTGIVRIQADNLDVKDKDDSQTMLAITETSSTFGGNVNVGIATGSLPRFVAYRATQFANNPVLQVRSDNGSSNRVLFEVDGDGTVQVAGQQEIIRTVDIAFSAANSVVGTSALLELRNASTNDDAFSAMHFRTGDGGDGFFGTHQGSAANDCTFFWSNQTDSGAKILAELDSATDTFTLNGNIKFAGLTSSLGQTSQPIITRSGSDSGSYPFDSYGHLILQARGDGTNKDIILATGGSGANKTIFKASGTISLGGTTQVREGNALELYNGFDNQKARIQNSAGSNYGNLEFKVVHDGTEATAFSIDPDQTANFSGAVKLAALKSLEFAAGDFYLRNNNVDNYIVSSVGNLLIHMNESRLSAEFIQDGACKFYYDAPAENAAPKLETTSTGATVSNNLVVNETNTLNWNASSPVSTQALRVQNSSNNDDSGVGIELKVHRGNGAAGMHYITNTAISTNYKSNLVFSRRTDASAYADTLTLTHDGNATFTGEIATPRFETQDLGIKIIGKDGGTAQIDLQPDLGDSNADKWKVGAEDNGHFFISNKDSGAWDKSIAANRSGNAELYWDGAQKAATIDQGFQVQHTAAETQLKLYRSDNLAVNNPVGRIYFIGKQHNDGASAADKTYCFLETKATDTTVDSTNSEFNIFTKTDGVDKAVTFADGGATFTGGEVNIKGASGGDATLLLYSDAAEDWNDKTRIRKVEGGDLMIEAYNGTAWEDMARFITGAGVYLYTDGVKKFTTISDGAEVTNAANNKVDLKFQYSNNSGYALIQMDNANNLILHADVTSAAEGTGFIKLQADGDTKLETYADGIKCYNHCRVEGAEGEGATLALYADEADDSDDQFLITSTGSALQILGNYDNGWHRYLQVTPNGGVQLYYDAMDGSSPVAKFETTSTGSQINGGASTQLKVIGTEADIWLTSNGSGSDKTWRILGSTGGSTHKFRIYDSVNTREPFAIDNDGVASFWGKATFGGGLQVQGHGDISTTGSTAHNYAYGRGNSPAGISIYGEEASFELVASDLSTHAGSILFRHHNNKGFGFVHNGTDETLELKAFISSADNFSIHGAGSQVSSLVTVLTAASDGDVTFKGDVGIPDNVLSVNTTDDHLDYNANQTAVVTLDTGAGSNSSSGPAQDMAIAINNVGSSNWGIGMQNISGSALGISLQFIDEGGDGCGYISQGNSGTTYSTSSDYRIKENAVDITDGITRLKQLKPYRFNFKKVPDKTVDGFFAHEAQTVVPEAVTGTKDEVDSDGKAVIQGIDQAKLVPLLVASLQEAIAKIEVLETEVAALKAGS